MKSVKVEKLKNPLKINEANIYNYIIQRPFDTSTMDRLYLRDLNELEELRSGLNRYLKVYKNE